MLYGIDTVIKAELHFFSNSKEKIDTCMNYTGRHLAIEIPKIRKAFIDAKARGIKVRYLTEITSENISFCKELMSIIGVEELRHLDGIKGSFTLSEKVVVRQHGSSINMNSICDFFFPSSRSHTNKEKINS